MATIDHTTFAVSSLEWSKAFYARALAPLGITLLVEVTAEQSGGRAFVGFGAEGKVFFWIGECRQPVSGVRVAFRGGVVG